MKKGIFSILSVALVASSTVWAQDQVKSGATNTGAPTTQTNTSKPLTVLGRVSDDGKTLVTDIDSEWAVSNVDALKGFEGRRVTVKCYVDSDRSRIHVLSAKASDVKYASRLGDSAFRR